MDPSSPFFPSSAIIYNVDISQLVASYHNSTTTNASSVIPDASSTSPPAASVPRKRKRSTPANRSARRTTDGSTQQLKETDSYTDPEPLQEAILTKVAGKDAGQSVMSPGQSSSEEGSTQSSPGPSRKRGRSRTAASQKGETGSADTAVSCKPNKRSSECGRPQKRITTTPLAPAPDAATGSAGCVIDAVSTSSLPSPPSTGFIHDVVGATSSSLQRPQFQPLTIPKEVLHLQPSREHQQQALSSSKQLLQPQVPDPFVQLKQRIIMPSNTIPRTTTSISASSLETPLRQRTEQAESLRTSNSFCHLPNSTQHQQHQPVAMPNTQPADNEKVGARLQMLPGVLADGFRLIQPDAGRSSLPLGQNPLLVMSPARSPCAAQPQQQQQILTDTAEYGYCYIVEQSARHFVQQAQQQPSPQRSSQPSPPQLSMVSPVRSIQYGSSEPAVTTAQQTGYIHKRGSTLLLPPIEDHKYYETPLFCEYPGDQEEHSDSFNSPYPSYETLAPWAKYAKEEYDAEKQLHRERRLYHLSADHAPLDVDEDGELLNYRYDIY